MSRSVTILMCIAALFTGALLAADPPKSPDDDAVVVTVIGTLKTNLVAIGGETTGTAIRSKGVNWELEFGKNFDLKKEAEKLNGKRVTVEGNLERRSGVEVKERWIITVTKLQAVNE